MFEKLEKLQVLIAAFILTAACLIAVNKITSTISKDTVTVTGSYSQNVISDSGSLLFELKTEAKNKFLAYEIMNKHRPVVMDYLHKQGFAAEDIEVKPFQGYNIYEINENGAATHKVAAFNASQQIQIKSDDVNKIKKVATDITALTEQGIDVYVYEPSYFYSKLSDLKVKMLEEATKDAKQRAAGMLRATDNTVGKIQSVKMGVFQITPVNSNDVSDSGLSDTSSIEKKVTSVVHVTFRVE